MASNDEYQQQRSFRRNSNLSEEMIKNGWVTENFNGLKVTYNKKFMNKFFGDGIIKDSSESCQINSINQVNNEK